MLHVIISIVIAFIVLLITEVLAKKKFIGQELSRKLPHIIAGVCVASWPFFVNMQVIVGLGFLFLAAAILVRELDLFSSARNVDRLSWGELFFPSGIIVAALISPTKWIFVAAILHLGVADALAALVGKSKGKRKFGHYNNKTLEGSVVFLVVSILITAWVILIAPTGLGNYWPIILWLPFMATIVEALVPWGLDNVLVPMIVAAALKLLPIG